MNVDSVAATYTALSQARLQNEVATRVMKTALKSSPDAQVVAALTESVQNSTDAVNQEVANLAASVDVYA